MNTQRPGITIDLPWDNFWAELFVVGVALLVALLLVAAWNTHKTRLPRLHENPVINLGLWTGGSLATALAGVALYEFTAILALPEYLDGDTDRHTALRNVGLLLVAIFSAPFLVWRTVIANHQSKTAEQGLYTDRIAKAVEQIGADKVIKGEGGKEETVPNIEVRIGGLLALERISHDSLRDHITVMEIICAYIRASAADQFARDPVPDFKGDRNSRTDWQAWAYDHHRSPRDDLRVALNILGRRKARQHAEERKNSYQLDLKRVNFTCLDLQALNLDNALLNFARMQGVNLWGANMQGAHLTIAKMQGANLRSTKMIRAQFFGAEMQGANLNFARMHRAHFNFTNLQGADLKGAEMQGADLRDAEMDEYTKLSHVDFAGAALRLADNTNVVISTEQIESTFGDRKETLPEHLAKPDHWVEGEFDWEDFNSQWRAWQKSIGFDPDKYPS